MDKRQDIGTRIKKKRKSLRLSQEELAELTGVARQTISAWERNFFVPKGENLIALARTLKTSVDSFTEEGSEGVPPPNGPAPAEARPFELAPFAQIYDYARKHAPGGSTGSRAEAIRILKLAIEEMEKFNRE